MEWERFRARIVGIHDGLERYTYYSLLNITQDASPDQIRHSFHGMARLLHPDRYRASDDKELKQKALVVYKQVTEAYRILMDHGRRREYDASLAQGVTRLDTTARRASGPKAEEQELTHPQAKKFFKLGRNAEASGDFKGAKMNYSFAKNFVGAHPLIDKRLAEVEAKLAEG